MDEKLSIALVDKFGEPEILNPDQPKGVHKKQYTFTSANGFTVQFMLSHDHYNFQAALNDEKIFEIFEDTYPHTLKWCFDSQVVSVRIDMRGEYECWIRLLPEFFMTIS